MNWSYSNFPQASPGFVYFNNPDSSNQDFIPFGASPQQERFAPQSYSSPNNRSFNQQWSRNKNRFSGSRGNNRSFSNASSSFSTSNDYSVNDRRSQSDNSYLIKVKFLQKSFLENPWEELEKKLEENRKCKQGDDSDNSASGLSPSSVQKRNIDMVD